MSNYSVQPYIEALKEAVVLQNNILMPGPSYVLKGKMVQGQPRFDLFQEATHIFTLNSFLAPLNCCEKEVTKLGSSPISRKLAIRITENIGLDTDGLKEIFHGNPMTATTSKVHITYLNLKHFTPLFHNETSMLKFLNDYPNLEIIQCSDDKKFWKQTTLTKFLDTHHQITEIDGGHKKINLQNVNELYPKITKLLNFRESELIKFARNCPNLLSIDSAITLNSASSIGPFCPKLEKLILKSDYRDLTKIIRLFSNLKDLDLMNINDDPLLIENVEKLIEVNLIEKLHYKCEFEDWPYFFSNTQYCRNLSEIDMIFNFDGKDDYIINLVENNPKLTSISFNYFGATQFVTEESILAIAKFCPELRTFKLDITADRITDQSITTLVKECKKLEVIKLFPDHLTNATLFAIGQYGHSIKKISVGGNFTIAGVLAVKHLPCLEKIKIYSNNISSEQIDPLRKQIPWINFSITPWMELDD